jgi:CheY-like chemotaxis protein
MELSENTKILLAEDNYINQRLVVLTLKYLKLTCDVASNGKEALEMHQKNLYDLILMDVRMPVMDGIEATRLIRQFEKEAEILHKVLIVALTASEPTEFKNQYQSVGMDGFLDKPVRVELLEEYLSGLK